MKSIDACPRGPMNRTARWLTRCVLLLAAWAWGTAVWAQAVVTAGPSNNSQSVLMFDVQAITPVTVTGFSTVLASATPSVEIWGRSGSHVGFTNNFAGWTLLGTTPTMAVTPGAVTALPLTLDVPLLAGETHAFMLRASPGHIGYRDGVGIDAPGVTTVNADANLRVISGTGATNDLSSNFTPRHLVGEVRYRIGAAATAVPTLGQWGLPTLALLLGALAWRQVRRRR